MKQRESMKLVSEIPSIKTQLDNNVQSTTTNIKNTSSVQNGSTRMTSLRPLVTIIDDDGAVEIWTKLKPLCEKKGIPVTLACTINGYLPNVTLMDDEKLRYMQNTLGCEIVAHSYSHTDLRLLTEEQLVHELRENKVELIKKGLDVKNFVAPFGSNDNKLVRDVASRYFNCGVTVGGGGVNTIPVKNQRLTRASIGSFYENDSQKNFDYHKGLIDNAVANKGWLIYMTHCWHTDHNAEQMALIEQVVDYAKAQGCEFVNLQKGFETFGNLFEVEDTATRQRAVITNQGDFILKELGSAINLNTFIKNGLPTKYFMQPTITNESPYTAYEKGISVMDFGSSITTNFPFKKAGILITYNITDSSMCYQTWTPYVNYSNATEKELKPIYFRRCKSDTEWDDWQILNNTRKYISDTVVIGAIPSKGAIYKNITVPYVGGTEGFSIVPQTTMPLEIMYSAQRVSNTAIAVTFFNTHTATLTPTDTKFIVSVTQ